ncbi:MAG TPA: endolytic transglycosylase MltG, partial [Candidatus Limnocylindrales bacterium]|nr:endolytic transglycosylase MltG [Candidatus Limnocylindrales bacterium]
ASGRDFYQVLTLASIVQQEAALDSERALIAGVYTNRLNPRIWSTGLLNADPTVFYAHDTIELRAMAFEDWQQFAFWEPMTAALAGLKVPDDLAGYQTYAHRGLPPGPICSPTAASIQAALQPDTSDGYLYFVAKGDGSHGHAFARTYAQHQANLRKYGYIK